MKKLFSILAIALMAVCFVGCAKSNDSQKEEATEVKEKKNKNTPEAVMKEFFKAQKECDFEKMFALTTLSEEEQAKIVSLCDGIVDENTKKEIAAMEFKISNVEISEDGESATVTYLQKDQDGTEHENTEELVKVDGKWKIYFEK